MSQRLAIALDRVSPVPLYHQLAEALRAALDAGLVDPDEPLETEVALAARLGISRTTVRQALASLVAEGRLERRHATGTYVVPPSAGAPR